MATSEPHSQLATEAKPSPLVSPVTRALSLVWAIFVALGGGAACGWCMSKLNDVGTPSLWALGFFAGVVGRKLQLSGRFAAWSLAIACLLAYLVAETCWLRWNTAQGEAGWWSSICLWSLFIKEYAVSAILGVAFAAFGAESAFRQTRRPHRAAL